MPLLGIEKGKNNQEKRPEEIHNIWLWIYMHIHAFPRKLDAVDFFRLPFIVSLINFLLKLHFLATAATFFLFSLSRLIHKSLRTSSRSRRALAGGNSNFSNPHFNFIISTCFYWFHFIKNAIIIFEHKESSCERDSEQCLNSSFYVQKFDYYPSIYYLHKVLPLFEQIWFI